MVLGTDADPPGQCRGLLEPLLGLTDPLMHSIWIIGGALGIFAMWMSEVDARWIGAFGVTWLGLAFNSIVQARNQADTAFSSVGVMLKKRWDLIPNLVDAVQRYVEHESQVLEASLPALRAWSGSAASRARCCSRGCPSRSTPGGCSAFATPQRRGFAPKSSRP